MPSFGKESLGVVDHILNNVIAGTFYTCPESRYAQSITAIISNGYGKLRYALYRRSDAALIAISEEINLPAGTPSGQITLKLPTMPYLTAGVEYGLVATSEIQCLISAAVNYANNGISLSNPYANGFPVSLAGFSATSFDYSIFLTYVTDLPQPANYILTVMPSINGSTIPVEGSYILADGTVQTVSAIANSGFEIDQWILDGVNAGSNPTLSVTMNQDHTVAVTFKVTVLPVIKHRLTINSTPIEGITPTLERV